MCTFVLVLWGWANAGPLVTPRQDYDHRTRTGHILTPQAGSAGPTSACSRRRLRLAPAAECAGATQENNPEPPPTIGECPLSATDVPLRSAAEPVLLPDLESLAGRGG